MEWLQRAQGAGLWCKTLFLYSLWSGEVATAVEYTASGFWRGDGTEKERMEARCLERAHGFRLDKKSLKNRAGSYWLLLWYSGWDREGEKDLHSFRQEHKTIMITSCDQLLRFQVAQIFCYICNLRPTWQSWMYTCFLLFFIYSFYILFDF